MPRNSEARKAMLEARRREQSSRVAGVTKRNAPNGMFRAKNWRPLALPVIKTGKQYNYEGKR